MRRLVQLFLASIIVLFGSVYQLNAAPPAEWTRPFPPFHIVGNLYYVGSQDLAAFLIVTPQGNILINSNLQSSPPQIKKSIESLGFHFKEIKILLISHGHYDHAAGSAIIKRLTGAQYEVMDGDVPVVQSGGRNDFQFARDKSMWFPPAHVDRVLHDRDAVSLGGTVLTAHKTAGHTKGTTTWTMDVDEAGKKLHVVIVGGPNVLSSYKLIGNHAYPEIAADFRRQFATLKALPCDVFLGAHGGFFDLTAKYERLKAGEHNAFVDPTGYQRYVNDRQAAFEAAFKHQQASGK